MGLDAVIFAIVQDTVITLPDHRHLEEFAPQIVKEISFDDGIWRANDGYSAVYSYGPWRYFGPGYQRGPWNLLLEEIMWMQQIPTCVNVYYGADNWHIANQSKWLVSPQRLQENTELFLSSGNRPYIDVTEAVGLTVSEKAKTAAYLP